MKVYLDNNVLISIEEKEIDFENFKGLFKNKVDFVYSYAHIQEFLEAKDDFNDLKKKRMSTILQVTNHYYAFPDGNLIEFTKEDPENVISTLKRFPEFAALLRSKIKNFNVDREQIIRKLEINKKLINNFDSKEVVNHLNTILEKNLLIDLNQMIYKSGTMLHEKIYSVFNFLDILGYWTDKKTHKSNIARAHDASHTFFASGCEYFISNDTRARNKAKVAYDLFEIKTRVYSYEELKTKNI